MAKFVVAALLLTAAVAMASRPAVTKEMVEHINSVQREWVASTKHSMAHLSAEDYKEMFPLRRADMMLKSGLNIPRKTYSAAERAAAPDSFDSREAWPQCSVMKQVRDQSHCGACWAFGAVESMSDRECIFNKEDVALSAEIMNSCSRAGSCHGGQPYSAWKYWVSEGIPTEECRAFSLPWCDHHIPGSKNPCPTNETYPTPKCVMQCVDGYPKTFKADLHYGKSVYWVTGEEDMKVELSKNGPFEVAIDVYEDFLAYQGGVYHHVSGAGDGGHAIKIIGYGEEDGVKYWTLANSWNPHWGEQGFFRIRRGNDECGVESEGVAGLPVIH